MNRYPFESVHVPDVDALPFPATTADVLAAVLEGKKADMIVDRLKQVISVKQDVAVKVRKPNWMPTWIWCWLWRQVVVIETPARVESSR